MNKGILISLVLPLHNLDDINEECSEIELLANTINYKIIQTYQQNALKINPSTYIGKGKINEIINKALLLEINAIFINDELRPSQLKNIKNLAKGKIEIIKLLGLIVPIIIRTSNIGIAA